MPVKCFLVVPSGTWVAHLRVGWGECPKGGRHHTDLEYARGTESEVRPMFEDRSKRPTVSPREVTCAWCGERGTPTKSDGGGMHETWRRDETGELKDDINDFGPGAMFFADWYKNEKTGLYGWEWDNQTEGPLHVICPNGRHWNIDSRASNCTMPNDKKHRCWIRHGTVPNITVDKVGHTCAAGAGSISAGDYHGFLRNGVFTGNL